MKLREGCPSYYNESDYKYFLAVDFLERAAATTNSEERENLARDAFSLLSKTPQYVDLNTVCKRFEDLRSVSFVENICFYFHCLLARQYLEL